MPEHFFTKEPTQPAVRIIWTLARHETALFFNGLIAYVILTVFLVGVGLFFWVFGGNILETGEASLDTLFGMAPWFFLFLIPALSMRAFAEEFKTGTIEFLATKPVTLWQILLGKYLAACLLATLALAPTLVYYLTVWLLSANQNVDDGSIVGAYLGLLGIGWVFCAIGVFASSVTQSQIVAFVLGVFLCFFFYSAFDFLAELEFAAGFSRAVIQFGVNEHYRSISRGVVDSRDVLYYLSMIVFFLALTKTALSLRLR